MFWFGKKKFENRLKVLDESVKNSFESIKKDMNVVGDWVNHFHNKHNEHDKRFEHIMSRIERLELLLKEGFIEDRPRRSSVHEHVQTFKRSKGTFMNVQTLDNIKSKLTPAEKKLVQLLYLAKRPLTYEELAEEMGLNEVTVRRYMNDIKRVGLKVSEKKDLDQKRKVFYIEKPVKRAISVRK